jgi:phage terminase Nu1 subunit (DNA packaging protein)
MAAKPERISAKEAALILGRPVRTVQDWAAQAKIPGAAKVVGSWTFDEQRLRNWIRRLEAEQCQEDLYRGTCTGVEESFGRGSKSGAVTIASRYKQLLSPRPASA